MGRGDTAQASKDEVVLKLGASGEYARKCTIRNNGSNIVRALVNVGDTARFAGLCDSGKDIKIPGSGASYTFEGIECGDIANVGYRTDTGTCGIYISAY